MEWVKKVTRWVGFLMRAVRILKVIALAIEDDPDLPTGARALVKQAISKAAKAEGVEGVLNKVIKMVTENR